MTKDEFDIAIYNDETLRAWMIERFDVQAVVEVRFGDRSEVASVEEGFIGSISELEDGRLVRVVTDSSSSGGEAKRFRIFAQSRDPRMVPILSTERVCSGMHDNLFGADSYLEMVHVHSVCAARLPGDLVGGIEVTLIGNHEVGDIAEEFYTVTVAKKLFFSRPIKVGSQLALLWRNPAIIGNAYVVGITIVDEELLGCLANKWSKPAATN
jgi:hypothetical protein